MARRSAEDVVAGSSAKKRRKEVADDFLEPLPGAADKRIVLHKPKQEIVAPEEPVYRVFWKAGDFEHVSSPPAIMYAGPEHARIHPRFLHSNATSHKWSLGAVAELFDNALDEVRNGATHINVDVLKNPRDKTPMLLFEDNGGGMTPDNLRKCISFGFSEKSKQASTIGQYGNGFKTSTMRLGSDVIVFTKSPAKNGKPATRSIGLLSYTFLRNSGQEDIVIPMLDWEDHEGSLKKLLTRGTYEDFCKNMDLTCQWSPFEREDLLRDQFKRIKNRGTRILIYNLWQDDDGSYELDLETDPEDIQVKGLRDENKVQMAEKHPSSRPFLTYSYSLRMYASILYLKLPENFRMVLRGKEIKFHNIIHDLMYTEETCYRPQRLDKAQDDVTAVVTLGFVRDARDHIDVQGFNVYHKNRLIKPFWRVWNSPSSQGRGVIGILEANFVEPTHNKQDFEVTRFLQRLEMRLKDMQKHYWNKNCHKVGYQAPARKSKLLDDDDTKRAKLDRSYLRSKGKEPLDDEPGPSGRKRKDFRSPSDEDDDLDEDEETNRLVLKSSLTNGKENRVQITRSGRVVRRPEDSPGGSTSPPQKRAEPHKSRAERHQHDKQPLLDKLHKHSHHDKQPDKQQLDKRKADKQQQQHQQTDKQHQQVDKHQQKTDRQQQKADKHQQQADEHQQQADKQKFSKQHKHQADGERPDLQQAVLEPERAALTIADVAGVDDKNLVEENAALRMKVQELTCRNQELTCRNQELSAIVEHERVKNADLEEQIGRMEKELQHIHESLLAKHDEYKHALEKEANEIARRRSVEQDEEEIRRMLKSTVQRLREVEVENLALKEVEVENHALKEENLALKEENLALEEKVLRHAS